MSTTTVSPVMPQQERCPSWCTDHDTWEDGAPIAHQRQVAVASSFDVRVNELYEVTAPGIEVSRAHVRLLTPEVGDSFLTSGEARTLARAIRRAAWIAEADEYQLASVAIGREVESVALAAGISVANLAHALGLTPRKMRRRLDGRRGFFVGELCEVALLLDVPLSVLVQRALSR